MKRIALGVEYNGSQFNGWQSQKNEGKRIRTVQTAVEHALSHIAHQPMRVICAGRTDAGVHATAQVIHMETEVQRPMSAWVLGSNAHLPDDVNICWAREMPDDFHARFSATQRHYRYLILNRPTRSALWAGRATWFFRALDAQRMQAAANDLLGQHDFSAYRAQSCQANTPIRTINRISIQRDADFIRIDLSANAFLQHMVRNIVGVLLAIGNGKAEVSWAKTVLESRLRSQGGVTALPDGLYLTQVDYTDGFILPDNPPQLG
jgi:tRNA pseudouridine38-40 synthase